MGRLDTDLKESSADSAVAHAALWVAALFLAVAVVGDRPKLLPSCPQPTEARAAEGWSIAVECPSGGAPDLGGAPDRPVRGPARLLFGGRIDLNRADARTLDVLPGIGPARAAAIVGARESRPFRTVAELERVGGIGPKTVAGLREWVEVSPVSLQGKPGRLPEGAGGRGE